MTNRIILLFLLSPFLVCSQYYNVAKNGLIIRNSPSLKGLKISKLKYLDYVVVEEELKEKTLTIRDNGREIKGFWVKIRHDKKPAYVFNGFLKTRLELRELKKEMDFSSILVNNKLTYKCYEKDFIKHLGIPDSIIINRIRIKENSEYISYEIKSKDKYKDLFKYRHYEYWDDVECSHFHGSCHRTQTFYKNGISYEKLDGEMILVNVDLKNKSNYIIYEGHKWDYKTTLKEIINVFPLIQTYDQLENIKTILPHDHFFAEIKWHMVFDKNNKLLEFEK